MPLSGRLLPLVHTRKVRLQALLCRCPVVYFHLCIRASCVQDTRSILFVENHFHLCIRASCVGNIAILSAITAHHFHLCIRASCVKAGGRCRAFKVGLPLVHTRKLRRKPTRPSTSPADFHLCIRASCVLLGVADAGECETSTCAYAQVASAKPYKILTCALCILVAGISPGWIILTDLPYRVLHLCKPSDALLGLRTPSRPIFGANLLRIFCSLWVRTLS